MSRPDYLLFDRNTTALIYGMQTKAVQRMLDFDFCCKRDIPSVGAMIDPGKFGSHKVFWGKKEIFIPVYPDIKTALGNHPDIDVMINFASYRSSFDTTMEALEESQLRTIVVIAEGIPERLARHLREVAVEKKKVLIGPATVGGIAAGAFKVANTGGTIESIIDSKLHRPGSVGFVSKSGGMSNEAYNIIALNTDGLYEGIAIGGDAYPGSTLLEHLLRFEANPAIKMLVCLGEVGGEEEWKIVEAVKSKKITKPLVMWVTGTSIKYMPKGIQFGHAGAKADATRETAEAKNAALKEAGVVVPESFDDYDKAIKTTYERLVKEGVVKPVGEEEKPPVIPMDYSSAVAQGLVRKPTNFTCTISDDSKEELIYAGHKISKVIGENYSVGETIGLLWFKERLPKWAAEFMEIVIKLCADHGPAVSGAHNTIVTARAGKDLMSAVASGILTIGPRFGGAVAGAALMFKDALDRKLDPDEFIAEMKKKNIKIQGIGHRIKSLKNPDMRVVLLKEFAARNFPATRLLDYALEVEQLTTAKKDTLILNVDGCIGVLSVDMMYGLGWSEARIKEVVDGGGLNGLFLLGRTIGMIGHYMDQSRQKAALYRHPWDDILYDLPPLVE
ncbi:MAG: ATP-citrate lyase alpha-subunit [Clostridiales bacterium]|nr:ATP-citrate lyase alpha-subunit [Clostridiales bacterium]MDN5283339.1 ATP-citrate lyase alpha-subunit [Candidatus Ozemobacter sp.]